MKPRIVQQPWRNADDLQKEVDYWQQQLNTDLRASSIQRAIYRTMRDWRQRQLEARQLWKQDRKQYFKLHGSPWARKPGQLPRGKRPKCKTDT